MSQLKKFIKQIEEKCRIALTIYDENGKFLLGIDDAPKAIKPVKSVVSEKDKTFFTFNFLGEKYIGMLDGIGDVNDGYVYLITELSGRYVSEIAPSSKETFYKELIDGRLSYLDAIKYADRLKVKEKKCAVLILHQEKGNSEDVISVVFNYVESESDCVFCYDKKRTVLIKFLNDDNKEYRSLIEYAEILSQTIYEETGIKIKVAIGGTVTRFIDLEKSFLQALSVFGMEKVVSITGNVRSFREFVIVKALDELTTQKKEEYLNLLFNDCNKEIFKDEVLCRTAEAFFESNLNVSMASRKTFLHRNTLTYRLDKIQRETGLDLRRYDDAVTFRLITVLNKLLER